MAFGVALPVHLMILDWYGIGPRIAYMVGGDAGVDRDGNGIDDDNTDNFKAFLISASTRLVLSTEPDGSRLRGAWVLHAGIGWMAVLDDVAQSGPFIELALGRRAGGNEGNSGDQVGFGLRWIHGREAIEGYNAVLVTYNFEHETGVDDPGWSDEQIAWLPYTIGFQLNLFGGIVANDAFITGFFPGFSLTFGIPFGRAIEARLRGSLLWLEGRDERDDHFVHTASGALRWRFGAETPLFVEAGAGYAWPQGTVPRTFQDGGFVDVSMGLRFSFCRGAIEWGLRSNFGLTQENAQFNTVLLYVGAEYGSWPGATGSQPLVESTECGWSEPPPPTPPVEPTPTPRPPSPYTTLGAARDPNAPHTVVVALPPSLVLADGPIVPISQAYLPMSELRIARQVQIEIISPAAAFPSIQQALRATLDRQSVPIASITHRQGGPTEVRAVFTIHPGMPAPTIQ
jgi:hypothetical protein